jgi:prolyl-tRNA editing enzyme YbaK/EbsC (Cys-tRNA(Pro) deacylase)
MRPRLHDTRCVADASALRRSAVAVRGGMHEALSHRNEVFV